MTDDRAAKYLWDARRAAERIARFTSGRTCDDDLGDEMLRSAVERQFEIIGEAFTGLRRVDPSLAATIPDLPRVDPRGSPDIVAFRNVLGEIAKRFARDPRRKPVVSPRLCHGGQPAGVRDRGRQAGGVAGIAHANVGR